MRAYEIRMHAARKANQLYDAGEKASGTLKQGNHLPRSDNPTTAKTLSDLGISKQEMSDWRKIAAVPEDQFEAALATRSVQELIDKQTPVSGDALLFIGTLRDFERRGRQRR